MNSRRSLLASVSALAAMSLVHATPGAAQDAMPVVASFSILGDMVERVGGEHVAVTTLVGRNGDAHVYQPTPQDARAVSEAEIMFVNGLAFEGWLDRLAEAASFDGNLVVATTGIEPIAFDGHGDEHGDHDDHAEHGDHDDEEHEEHADAHGDHDHAEHEEHAEAKDDHDHDHEDHADAHGEHDHDEHEEHAEAHGDAHGHEDDHAGHDHGGFDPHAWLSPTLAITYVDNIAAALAQSDPANAATFYENRASYVAELEALNEEIVALTAGLPDERRTVVTSHDAFQYFARDYGFTFIAPQGVSTESEASAQDVARIIEQIREEGVSAVFVENISDSRLLEQIANETGASIGGTLYPGALSEEDGPAATYLDLMRHNATVLSEAIGS
ncbi:MAG: zinc ABC transporter substrate-binding protein [Pseudomonadota bacterium]